MKTVDACELLKALPNEITAFDAAGCHGCGECCGQFLPMSEMDAMVLHRYIERHGIEPVYQPILCPFLDLETRECKVYVARPTICRTYDCRKHKDGTLFEEALLNHQSLQGMQVVDMAAEFCKEVEDGVKELGEAAQCRICR